MPKGSNTCPFNPYKCPSHFTRHVISTIVLVLVTLAAGLYLAGSGIFSPFSKEGVSQPGSLKTAPSAEKGSYDEGYQAALDFAKEKLEKDEVVPGLDDPVDFINDATVKSVSGQNVVIEFKASELDILAEGMVQKTAVATEDTMVAYRVFKDPEALEKEQEEYDEALRAYFAGAEENPSAEEPEEPSNFIERTITIGDLKVGDSIQVGATEDMRMVDSFDATRIYVIRDALPEPELDEPMEEAMDEGVMEE